MGDIQSFVCHLFFLLQYGGVSILSENLIMGKWKIWLSPF